MTQLSPNQLSRELRQDRSPDMRSRRLVIGLSLFGAAMAQIVSLYQTGIVNHLPDLPLPVFDADQVDALDYAYKRLSTPDGLIMLANYAATAWLAGARCAQDAPWLPILTVAKIGGDTLTALQLAREEWADHKNLCAYCQVATLASAVSLVLALPEARQAWLRLRG